MLCSSPTLSALALIASLFLRVEQNWASIIVLLRRLSFCNKLCLPRLSCLLYFLSRNSSTMQDSLLCWALHLHLSGTCQLGRARWGTVQHLYYRKHPFLIGIKQKNRFPHWADTHSHDTTCILSSPWKLLYPTPLLCPSWSPIWLSAFPLDHITLNIK